MARLRMLTAVTGVAVALLLSGCIVLPPAVQPAPPVPQPQPLPSQPSQTAPPTTSPTHSPTPSQQSAPRVEPDVPVTTDDQTTHDTGELYAGEPGLTSDGYFPDGAIDMVLEPTTGTPQVGAVPYGEADAGDEFLAGQPHDSGNLVLSTAGQLVMTGTDGSQYTCSATVINSASDNIVVTAAHCAFDDDTRSEYASIEFAPGYEDGNAPYGTWDAEDWWVPAQYLEANDRWLDGADDNGWMGFDYAFIRFGPNDAGQELEQVTGGQGVTFTAETDGVLVAGYPANDDFDGEILRYCSSDDVNYGAGGDPNYGIECEMGSGASGSGWITGVDEATGAGYIAGIYSNGSGSGAYGPPLGGTAYNGLESLQD